MGRDEETVERLDSEKDHGKFKEQKRHSMAGKEEWSM